MSLVEGRLGITATPGKGKHHRDRHLVTCLLLQAAGRKPSAAPFPHHPDQPLPLRAAPCAHHPECRPGDRPEAWCHPRVRHAREAAQPEGQRLCLLRPCRQVTCWSPSTTPRPILAHLLLGFSNCKSLVNKEIGYFLPEALVLAGRGRGGLWVPWSQRDFGIRQT